MTAPPEYRLKKPDFCGKSGQIESRLIPFLEIADGFRAVARRKEAHQAIDRIIGA
jgi:hypothetical protein